MSAFSERLHILRLEKQYSQQDLATLLKMSKSSVNMYERGEREPSFETMEAIADIFNVDMNYLYGKSEARRVVTFPNSDKIPEGFQPMPKMVKIPRIGQIACGEPILAEQNIDGEDMVPADWHATFSLMCKGDSMSPRIHDGDIVCIRKQINVENGEIAAVRIENEATLKHVYIYNDHIVLQPENPEYSPIVLFGNDINNAVIEGKAVGLCRKI